MCNHCNLRDMRAHHSSLMTCRHDKLLLSKYTRTASYLVTVWMAHVDKAGYIPSRHLGEHSRANFGVLSLSSDDVITERNNVCVGC